MIREIFFRTSFILFLSLCFLGFAILYQERDIFSDVIFGGVYIQFMLFTPYFVLVFRHENKINELIAFLSLLIYLKAFSSLHLSLFGSIIISSVVFYILSFKIVIRQDYSFENIISTHQIIPIKILLSQSIFIKYFVVSISVGFLNYLIFLLVENQILTAWKVF